MTVRMTQALVAKLKKNGKQYYVRSDDRSGFAVRVSPAGRKTYTLRYRPAGAKGEKDFDIGLASEISCDAAHKKARQMRAEFDKVKEQPQYASDEYPLFSVLEKHLQRQCSGYYRCEYIPHTEPNRRTREWPHSLVNKHRAYLRVYEHFGKDFDARKLTSLLVEEFHIARTNAGAIVGANQDIRLMSPAFHDLVKHKIISENPCKYVTFNQENPNKTGIPLESLDEFLEYLDEYQNIVAASAVKFAIFSGIRKMRTVTLSFKDLGDNNYIDVERRIAVMRDHKSYSHTKQPEFIYLSHLAMDVIPKRSQKHIENNHYVFYTRNRTHIAEKTFDNAFNYAKGKMNFPPALAKKITPYCARHTFAAIAKVRGKVDMHTLSKMMSHADTQMVERHYLQIEKQFDEDKRRAIDEIFAAKKE